MCSKVFPFNLSDIRVVVFNSTRTRISIKNGENVTKPANSAILPLAYLNYPLNKINEIKCNQKNEPI